jgi:putative transposase
MTQSMSRVGCGIDNGPMEGFWGILKSEMYYLQKFDDPDSLKKAIEEYMDYYNTRQYQKRLNCMTPLEYHNYLFGVQS